MGIIYCARNKVNGKLYIGKTNHTLEWRKKKHESMAGASRYYFHQAIDKYGRDSFEWSILDMAEEECKLSDMEREYIDLFSSSIHECGYNLTHGGDGASLNDISRAKISASNTGKQRTPEMKEVQRKNKIEYYKTNAGYWTGKNRPETMKHISTIRVYEHFCRICGIYFNSHGSRLEYCNSCNPNPIRNRKGAFLAQE